MTEMEYREVEARLDEALAGFNESPVFLAADERRILENLIIARKEVHELRIEQESEGAA